MTHSISSVHDKLIFLPVGSVLGSRTENQTQNSTDWVDYMPIEGRFSTAEVTGSYGNGEMLPSPLTLFSDGSPFSTARTSNGDTLDVRLFSGMLQFRTDNAATGLSSATATVV